ncbi:MAG: efflux RND transporter permease subunit [Bacteroidota bacterium]
MWATTARIILRNRVSLLLLLGILTTFMLFETAKIQLSYEFARVLPDNDQEFLDYQKFKQQFGEDGAVMVAGIADTDFYDLPKFNDWYGLTTSIKNIDGIEEVISDARMFHLYRNDSINRFELKQVIPALPKSQEEVDSLKKEVYRLPFYDGLIFNKKNAAHLIAITFDRNKLNTQRRIDIIKKMKVMIDDFGNKHHLQVHYSGMPYIRTAISNKVANELILFIILALLVTGLILLIFFRSFHVVFFSLLVVLIGVIWSIGIMALFGYKITILTGLIPPLIIVIGVPNSIILLNKYHYQFQIHRNKMLALARMIEKVGYTIFFANVTTAIGFGVFYFTNSRLLMEFGIIAAINVMTTYIVSLIIIPIVYSFMPVPSIKNMAHLDRKMVSTILNKITYWVQHYRKAIYFIVVLVTLISVYGITLIHPVAYVVDDIPKKDPIYQDLKFFEKYFKGIMPFEISIDTKKDNGVFANNANVIYKTKRLEKMMSEFDYFSKPNSLVEAIQFANQAFHDGNPKYYILPAPSDLNELKPYVDSTKQKENKFHSFIDSSKRYTRVSYQMADVGSVRMKEILDSIRPRIDSIFPAESFDVKITGSSLIFLKGNSFLIINLEQSVLLAILLIAFIMLALFRSIKMVFISIIPSLIPLIITAGVIGFFHIPLKPSTILIFSIAFGISSDGTMYFLTKYRQELKNNQFNISKTVSLAIAETGISMVYTAFILFFGFFIFTASNFGGTAALGILISFTLLVAYASNLILLPCFLLSLEKRITTKAFLENPVIQMVEEDENNADKRK